MVKQEAYKGVFGGMDFPSYEYEHYPLMLTKGAGKTHNEQLIVENAEEEKAALADGWIAPKRIGPPVSLTQKELDAKDAELADLKEQLRRAKMTPEARAAEDKAKAAAPQATGSATPPQATGSATPPQATGSATPPQATGSATPVKA